MSARVLVIDDSPILLDLTVKALSAAGFDAASAVDLASLEQALAAGPVDLILVDVNMPEMFGDDVVEFLRSQRKVDAKLLLYSDLPEKELAQRAKASGADGFVAKSAGLEAAVAEVRSQLGISASGQGAQPLVPRTIDGRKGRILIVDDSEMVGHVLQSELQSRGYEVFVADSAEKATRIILKKPTRPDLVLLDVLMPKINGEQLCRFIKGNSLFAGIKVILCSSERPDELRRICRDAGADGFVTKEAVLAKVLASEES